MRESRVMRQRKKVTREKNCFGKDKKFKEANRKEH